MRVAVVGTGAFAKHFFDELPAAGHEVVALTRSHKDFLDGKNGIVEQRITDYSSVAQLAELLRDCDALISTVSGMDKTFADVHLALVEACKLTPKCKRFIPSEFGGNTEDHPETPDSIFQFNAIVKNALKEQNELEWTVISLGWLADYVVLPVNRYHGDIGPLFPLDRSTNTMTIPGTGNEPFSLTSARDTAKAVAELLKRPNKWRNFTYVQGTQTTWLQVAETMKTAGGIPDLNIVFESVNALQEEIAKKESFESVVVAEFKLYVPTGALKFDQVKVQRDRDEFFPNIHFRTAEELLKAVEEDSTVIV